MLLTFLQPDLFSNYLGVAKGQDLPLQWGGGGWGGGWVEGSEKQHLAAIVDIK